jgi:hypothetical protein
LTVINSNMQYINCFVKHKSLSRHGGSPDAIRASQRSVRLPGNAAGNKRAVQITAAGIIGIAILGLDREAFVEVSRSIKELSGFRLLASGFYVVLEGAPPRRGEAGLQENPAGLLRTRS